MNRPEAATDTLVREPWQRMPLMGYRPQQLLLSALLRERQPTGMFRAAGVALALLDK